MKKNIAPMLLAALLAGCSTHSAHVDSSSTSPAGNAVTASTQWSKASDDFMDPRWQEARDNIKWVLTNPGAQANFTACLTGQSNPSLPKGPGSLKYKCVLYAEHQGKGRPADTIRAYGPERTERYIDSLSK